MNWLMERHNKLVNLKFTTGISADDAIELERIRDALDDFEERQTRAFELGRVADNRDNAALLNAYRRERAHRSWQAALACVAVAGLAREVVVCAAIRLPDGRVIRGHRHGDCIRTAKELVDHRHSIGLEPTNYEGLRGSMAGDSQGFISSRNRYVTRAEGMQLQLAAGIESVAEGGYRGTLFSEDLY